MTGDEMKSVRERLGQNQIDFGIDIGYRGKTKNIGLTIHRYENGLKSIPPWIAVTVRVLDIGGLTDAVRSADNTGALDDDGVAAMAKALTDHLIREEDEQEDET